MTWSAKDIDQQKELSERILRYRVELACLEHCREEVTPWP